MSFPANFLKGPRFQTRKGLLVIDLQNDFLKEDGKLFIPNTREFLLKLPSMVARFREKGEVFWVQTEFHASRPTICPETDSSVILLEESLDTRDTNESLSRGRLGNNARMSKAAKRRSGRDDPEAFLGPRQRSDFPRCCLPKTEGSQVPTTIAKIIDSKKDSLVVKSEYSAFNNTSLLPILRTKLVTQLYIAGSLSNVSVYATALDAVRHGLEVTVVEDCVGYRSSRCHEEAMRQMADAMGVNGTDYQELMDDLGGLLGEVVTASTFQSSVGARPMSEHVGGVTIPEHYSMRSKVKRWIDDMNDGSGADGDPGSSDGGADAELGSAKRRSLGTSIERIAASSRNGGRSATSVPPLQTRMGTTNGDGERHITSISPPAPSPRATRTRVRRPHQTVDENRSLSDPTQKNGTAAPDLPDTPKDVDAIKSTGISPLETESEPNRRKAKPTSDTVERVKAFGKTLRADRQLRQAELRVLGPGDFIGERDSRIVYDFLSQPEHLDKLFADLSSEGENSEICWQKMLHRAGEVPRLVAVQGETESDGVIPVYRHPIDESPPLLPFSPSVQKIREEVEQAIGHPVNHVLIQRYRSGEDSISEHSDKTLDVVRGSSIVNVSLGAMRTMTLRTKKSASTPPDPDLPRRTSMPVPGPKSSTGFKKATQRVPLPHNSLFVLGPATNRIWMHAIRPDRRPHSAKTESELAFKGERISLTFRQIGTFINPRRGLIWGQGATRKTKEEAQSICKGVGAAEQSERMIRAFGQENHQSYNFDWFEHYGLGFDVIETGTQDDTENAR